jgi:5-methylcytosine-specific restriction endonuclease McrA
METELEEEIALLKPQKRRASYYSHITTLVGLSLQEQINFSYNNVHHFFRVTLYDKSHLCAKCNLEIVGIKHATLDHIVPRSKGGRTRLSNLQLMHPKCNSRKSDEMPEKYDPRAFQPINQNRESFEKHHLRRYWTFEELHHTNRQETTS